MTDDVALSLGVAPLRAATRSPKLSLLERVTLGAALSFNERPALKRLSNFWTNSVVGSAVKAFCEPRLQVLGAEHVVSLSPPGGVLLAANHRTFFDLFAVAYAFRQHTKLCRSLHFPVRSGFWYDNPLGFLVNAFGAGLSMFPPVFRPAYKREVTRQGLDWLAERLTHPGVVVGMHPEGTRSRGQDPFELLPAEQSFGRVALLSRATILPVFVTGLSDSLWQEARQRRRRQEAVQVVFGPAVSMSEFEGCDPMRLRFQLAAGERVLQAIQSLAERVRPAT